MEKPVNHLSRQLYFRLLKTALLNLPIYCDRLWQSLPNPCSIHCGNIVCILLPSNEISHTIFNMRFVFDVSASSLWRSTTPRNRLNNHQALAFAVLRTNLPIAESALRCCVEYAHYLRGLSCINDMEA